MSFMSGGGASATVVAAEPLQVFAVAKPDLDVLLKRDRGVEAAILRVLGRDLAAKLKTQHR
jgi:hypothetical protein